MATWTSSRLSCAAKSFQPTLVINTSKTAEHHSSQRPPYTLKMTMTTKLKYRSTTL